MGNGAPDITMVKYLFTHEQYVSPYINYQPVVEPMSRWTSTMEEIQIKGHTMCLKDFEEQIMPVAETLPLTYLYDRACWPA